MKLIKIIDANGFETSPEKLTEHLTAVLQHIRKNKLFSNLSNDSNFPIIIDDEDEDLESFNGSRAGKMEISYKDKRRISDRAIKLSKARLAAAGLAHLKSEERDRLQPALRGMQIVMPKGQDWADEIAAQLHEEMPWMQRATEYIWHALRRSAQRGEPITLRPVILNGPPGIGKSVWARSLAEALTLPFVDVDASKGGAGMALVGVERGWGTALPGRPIDLLLSKRVANPLIVVDEICKARTITSTRGARHAFADALLSLLEPATALKWECQFFRLRFDMSHISWVLTSNDIENVPEPVRSRCQVIEIPDVTVEHLHWFARSKGAKLGLSVDSIEAIVMAITQAPVVTKRRQSLRDVMRLLDRAEVLEGRPKRH
ncbi:MAG: AAA family ATPase [Yoonia sp.]|nr:AAA family ATPase [Yoonia sp.]